MREQFQVMDKWQCKTMIYTRREIHKLSPMITHHGTLPRSNFLTRVQAEHGGPAKLQSKYQSLGQLK